MANSKRILGATALLTLLAPIASVYQSSPAAAADFADPAFQRVWTRTDKPVADKSVVRSWYWGPTPGETKTERYVEGAGGNRKVQYFDKSRMEINDPNKDKNDPFYVTNGLLTIELVSGKMQVGNSQYETRYPAHIPLASDTDDPNAPTYASFGLIANSPLGDHPALDQTGKVVGFNVNKYGIVARDASKDQYNVKYGFYNNETKHNIADKFWEFLNAEGQVMGTDGKMSTAKMSDPWFYTTGFAISEPYWANVKIAGRQQDVLIQLFERRVLTYVPAFSPEWRVQMGNIGAHYYDWRYRNAGEQVIANADVRPVQVAAGQLGSPQNPIKMAFVPSSQTTRVTQGAEPVVAQLSRITGYSYRISVPTSYAAVIEAIGSNQVDVAWLAPFSYVLAREKYGSEVILSAVRKGFLTYPSVFITADPNVKSVADMKGKKFAFVDPTSASGYLYPVAYLKNVGLVTGDRIGIEQLEAYFGRGNVLIAGGHDKVVTAVYNGQVAGGAVFGGPLDPQTGNPTDARNQVVGTLRDVYQKVKIVGETQQIPNDTVSVRKGLPPDVVKQIQNGLLELTNSAEGRKALYDLYQIDDLTPVTDSFYDPVRQVARDVGVQVETLFPTPTPRP